MRTLKTGRGTDEDKPPVLTLVGRSNGRVWFLVRNDLQDVDEDIAEYGDETVILCTDDYGIYNEIDDYNAIDVQMAVNRSETYMTDDVHVNTCENRHNFLRQWLAKLWSVFKRVW